MISKTIRIAVVLVLAAFALSTAARAANCSNASLSGTYGFLHDSTDSTGASDAAAVTQITFASTTGTFTGETTTSHEGVIATASLSGTYTIDSDCTGTGIPAAGSPFSIVVTSTGFLAVHPFSEGFALEQGAPACSNATLEGTFGFETTGLFLAGAPATGWVAFIGNLKLTATSFREGVISGHLVGAEGDTALPFAPVTGSYSIASDCTGTATITPKGQSPLNFSFVVVHSGKKLLVIETDADTVVSGTLVKDNETTNTKATARDVNVSNNRKQRRDS
jgi:hypothetical protein